MRNITAVLGVALILAASYGLTRAGDPQSHWLWCTVLKACP